MKNPVKTIRVILADDHTLVRAGIRALLEKLPAVAVVGEASDGREVLNLVQTLRPDVVLMDIGMPGLNGLEATARMARDFPETRTIILSMHHNEEYVSRALKSGAAGYLLKKAATAEVEAALHAVVAGRTYLSREIPAKTISINGDTSSRTRLEQLTSRQREILQLIAEGQNTKQIADVLHLSPKTVEYHRMKMMAALNVYDIPGLVRFALRTGLLPEESTVNKLSEEVT